MNASDNSSKWIKCVTVRRFAGVNSQNGERFGNRAGRSGRPTAYGEKAQYLPRSTDHANFAGDPGAVFKRISN